MLYNIVILSSSIFPFPYYYVKACMLSFYPDFETDPVADNEIVFFLDLSNSMKVLYWLEHFVDNIDQSCMISITVQ